MSNVKKALDILNNNLLIEMATLGTYDNHKVTLYTEPYGNPSFHLNYKNEWEVVLEIEGFEILEVKKGKFKKGEIIPNKEMKALLNWFELTSKDSSKLTNWESLIFSWNTLNPKYKIHPDLTIAMVYKGYYECLEII